VVAQADANDVDDRILHRHLDMLAAPARMALLQRGENADRMCMPVPLSRSPARRRSAGFGKTG